jgi:zinc/manganese transport system substrate-binding protein
MKKIILIIAVWMLSVSAASAKIVVGASLPDLASIAAAIGGDRVDVFSIARGTSDPHSVEVLSTYMVRVSRADVYLKVGLQLDQWADAIVEGARNSKLIVVDCSKGVSVLEKPSGTVDASMGDVHPSGNPHYWLDPLNGLVVAQNVTDALCAVDPAGAEIFRSNLARFTEDVKAKMSEWTALAAALPNRHIVTYHSSWTYFSHAFGFEIVAKIEPVPGIPPTAGHLAELLKIIREGKITTVIQEPYFSDDGANYLARETGVKVLKIAPSCDGVSASAYLDHFRQIFEMMKMVP